MATLRFAPLDAMGTQLFFRLVAAAYERRSLGIGSPLAASRLSRPGPTSIPGPGVVAAALLLAVVGSASLAQPKRAAV